MKLEGKCEIREIFMSKKIYVPSYQRAYSWDTPKKESQSKETQTDVFLQDLEDYKNSNPLSPYYFGHFLFEKAPKGKFYVIDGQQRLTTIVIFLSALFRKLKSIRRLEEDEGELYENIIKRQSTVRFNTVEYDNDLFEDYVIFQNKINKVGIKTKSGERIIEAFDYFTNELDNKDEEYLREMLYVIAEASCTAYTRVS